MAHNALLTGPPRSGKSTAIRRLADRLDARGRRVGGVYCPAIRSGGDRVGFEVVDAMTGASRVLAHVDREAGPAVGKYRVDVGALDAICSAAFPRALDRADAVVVDEVAPMQVASDAFVDGVRRALEDDRPLVAAVHGRSTEGFVGEVKDRDGVERFEVTEATRDRLPATLAERVLEALEDAE